MASETHSGATHTSMQQARAALDAALKGTQYSCKRVSWDDVSRSHANGSLSAIGPNITDTYLRAADGASLYTIRSDNWNEKLGMISAKDITLLKGNCDGVQDGSLSSITLDKFLANPFLNGAQYAGLTGDLSKSELDTKVSIRFQTVFLPLGDDNNGIQFASEAYNYQTSSDTDPRNIILLATTQGLSVQAGAAGKKRLLLHHGNPGDVKAYWMKAEASRHKVGAEQKDTAEERADALARGSATSARFGTAAMGERFNALMTIQVPLLQKKPAPAFPAQAFGLYTLCSNASASAAAAAAPLKCGLPSSAKRGAPAIHHAIQAMVAKRRKTVGTASAAQMYCSSAPVKEKRVGTAPENKKTVGTASAARVSRGNFVHNVRPLPLKGDAVRHPDEHVTVTVVLYHAVKDGVPSATDARAAVEELDCMFAACEASGKLADKQFNPLKFGAIDNDDTSPSDPVMKDIDIVRSKIKDFANVQNKEKYAEMRLITLGAIEGVARKTVAKKLDAIKWQVDQGNVTIEQSTIDELKLLVKGALCT